MPDDHEYIFTYGTLKPGYGNYRRIEQFVRDSKPGSIRGILVDLGPFPALVKGEGIVRGMLLKVDREAIKVTDYIEGYSPDRKQSLYIREEVQVDLDNGDSIKALTYFFADPDRLADCPRLVVGYEDDLPVHEWPVGA